MGKLKAFCDEIVKWFFVAIAVVMFILLVGGMYYVDHLRFCH